MLTLALIVFWLSWVGLVGLGALWPARTWLAQQTGLAQGVYAFWLGYAWLSMATMAVGAFASFTPFSLVVISYPLAALGLWHLARVQWRLGWQDAWPVVLLLALAALSLPTAMLPPTEADSLAYHFALPKLYAEAGHLVFAPVAVTFAGPQFAHMVFAFAYALQGEPLLLAAAWASSLMAAVAVFALARVWLPTAWATAVAAILIGTPVFTYAFSNGTVELRQAGLMAAAMLALAATTQRRHWAPVVLLGVFVGGVVASKFFGLFMLPPLVLVWFSLGWCNRDNTFWRHTALLAGVGLAVALPWYVSNWWHYGSPLFPALCSLLHCPDWSAAQQAYMQKNYLNTELMLPRNFGTLLSYPVTATFAGAVFDSDRVGLGPFLVLGMLAAVVVVVQSWRNRAFPLLAGLGVLALGYYVLFFWLGVSGRSRHLLVVLPLLLVLAAAVGHACWPRLQGWAKGLVLGAVMGVVLVQSAMAVLLNRNAALALISGQPPSAYLTTQAAHYSAAQLANTHLTATDKLLVLDLRTALYYLKTPYFHHQLFQTQVLPFLGADSRKLWQALQAQGFTAWLTEIGPNPHAALPLLHSLIAQGCAALVATQQGMLSPSRTAQGQGGVPQVYALYRLTPPTCLLAPQVLEADKL